MANPVNILKINSSSRQSGSVSRQLTDRIADRLTDKNAEAPVVSRNVSTGLSIICEDWVGANFTPAEDRSANQQEVLKSSDELISELRAADIILIGLPIYNFSIPAALKTWIDLICRVGETFHYTENGPVGLLTDKRVIVSVASGGVPIGSPMDHATPYLTQVLGFIGITDVTYVSATGSSTALETSILAAEGEIDALDLKIAV